jgi:hypothetical protein
VWSYWGWSPSNSTHLGAASRSRLTGAARATPAGSRSPSLIDGGLSSPQSRNQAGPIRNHPGLNSPPSMKCAAPPERARNQARSPPRPRPESSTRTHPTAPGVNTRTRPPDRARSEHANPPDRTPNQAREPAPDRVWNQAHEPTRPHPESSTRPHPDRAGPQTLALHGQPTPQFPRSTDRRPTIQRNWPTIQRKALTVRSLQDR